jgi:hypothetical protein
MGFAAKARRLPGRVTAGEITLGTALLLPLVATAVAGAG